MNFSRKEIMIARQNVRLRRTIVKAGVKIDPNASWEYLVSVYNMLKRHNVVDGLVKVNFSSDEPNYTEHELWRLKVDAKDYAISLMHLCG